MSVLPWPVLTQVVLMVYMLVLVVYYAWPVTLFNMDAFPFINFMTLLSITKFLIPVIGTFMAIMHLGTLDMLGLFIGLIVLALLDSIILLFTFVVHWVFANRASGSWSYGNDPLYCCVHACSVAYSCSTNPVLKVNQDLIVMLSFQVILIVFEALSLTFMIQMYNTLADSTKRFSWKSASIKSAIASTPGVVVTTLPTIYQQLEQNLTAIAYGHVNPNLKSKKE